MLNLTRADIEDILKKLNYNISPRTQRLVEKFENTNYPIKLWYHFLLALSDLWFVYKFLSLAIKTSWRNDRDIWRLLLPLNFIDAASPYIESSHIFHDWVITFLFSIAAAVSLWMGFSFYNTKSHRLITRYEKIEYLWSFTPCIILWGIALPSLTLLYFIDEGESGMTVKTMGHQWYWEYDYPDALNYDSYMISSTYRFLDTDNRLILIVNEAAHLFITSADVLHSWTLPTMAVKADAVPGRINKLTVWPKRPGLYYGQCSEICGSNHRFIPIAMECSFNYPYTLKV